MGRWALVGLLLQLLDSLRGLLDGSWNSPGAPFGALGASLGAPERQKTSKKPPSDTPSFTSPSFVANSQKVLHFSYIFKNAPGRKCAGWRAARRNVGATGEELKEGKGVQKLANLKRSCLDPALSPCLTRRRGGGGSLRAFRRAREGEARGRWNDGVMV